MLEVLLDNKNGNVWDISDIVGGVQWKTTRIGSPGSLDFTLVKPRFADNDAFVYRNGDIVRVRKDGRNVFYGYIFAIESGADETVKMKAYDQIRYLHASDTYVLTNVKASDVVRRIAKDFKLSLGYIADTVYSIPTLVEDGKKLIDIIYKTLDLTLINKGLNFVLYDDFGRLTLRNVEDMLVDFYIGEGSLMHGYSFKTSIDQDTYNKIVLYQDNRETGKRDLYVARDSANMARWGILQLYQSVDEKQNAAQIQKLLDTLAKLKNRETKSLKIEALGDLRIRAGSYVRILIRELGLNQPFLVDACTHDFDGTDHTMSLELKMI
ncbi:phage-like element PBSX protein XkdQ [Paenibacillus sp. 32O-W]|uniref:XkdQ/YqbQ family protein n=1 Tax=Paenibacillus sp. 32O-W TaxID=1695218 RepID=UPI0007211F47|nr:hypothetical protein [Paenibacillus sp. 32O-W]ALS25488.1 phage-like element PBSX protein XkdQ [Paenibacillus sp. 32O-W]